MFVARELKVAGVAPLSFEVGPGEVLAVAGASGSGKTRLLRALADLDPHRGEVSWLGRAADSMTAPEWRQLVGLLPAEPRFWRSRVADHFPEANASLADELASLDLNPEVGAADPARLSTGERSRIAVLRLLARSPEVLLLDEPTANLDAANRRLVVARITRYRSDRDAAVIWVSHTPEAASAAARTLELPDGNLTVAPMKVTA